MNLRTVTATRYVTPLREGGSLPAIIEADDDGMYVLKFRGAGQGPKALIAELISGELARLLGLPVPEIVLVELDPVLARTEPDPEIQDLIKASAGLNLALDYLPESVTFDPLVEKPDGQLASSIVWFDAFTTNVDRTPRNANMLMWHDKLWLIDHGASLYFHHGWRVGDTPKSKDRFTMIKDHVLLPFADALQDVDIHFASLLTPAVIIDVLNEIPESWLVPAEGGADVQPHRDVYAAYLSERLEAPRDFLEEAIDARLQNV